MTAGGDQRLTEADLAAFARLGIGADLLAAAQVARVTDREAREGCGIRFTPGANLAGIAFPYLDPRTGERRTARLRRDRPEMDAAGRPKQKYLCPFGDARHIYFPPGAGLPLADQSVPVAIVEAEKSALAITALAQRAGRNLLAIATGGCWGWRGQIGIGPNADGERVPVKGALPDLDLIAWPGREAIICFDANAASNPKVQAARRALAEELGVRGARVSIAALPDLPTVNGPDDLIAASGDSALLGLLDAALPLASVAMAEAEAAIAAMEANPEAARRAGGTAIYPLIAAVPDADRREVLVARAAKTLKIPKSSILGTLRRDWERIERGRKNAAEQARIARLVRMAADPAQLIGDLEVFFSDRAFLPPHAAQTLALCVMNTWVFDAFDTTPYFLLDSAVPQCGKTTVLRLLEAVVREPRQATSTSEAALFRMIEAFKPTLLIDEAEMLSGKGERAEAVTAIANVGYKRGASVPRCTGEGGTEIKDFPVYCPKVFAAIGGLRGALLDRCIVIIMARRPAGVRLKPVKEKALRRVTGELRERLEAYALQEREALAAAYDSAPDEGYWPGLADREAELWEPLLLHARLAGPAAEARALEAALSLSARKQQIQGDDLRFALARELLDALAQWGGDKFAPGDLLGTLEEAEAWGARLAEKHESKAKAAAVGQFIRTLRLQSRERTRTGTLYLKAEAIEKLRAITPEKSATSATPATAPAGSGGISVAAIRANVQRTGNASVRVPDNAADSGAVAAPVRTPATPPAHVNGQAVADVADVAENSGPGGGYWGQV